MLAADPRQDGAAALLRSIVARGLAADHPQPEMIFRFGEGDARPVPVEVFSGGTFATLS